ncbi:MAG TPA: alpha/beta fold hydrolase [Acidobacteriaceae bacterium]|jgi:pimeloyl-ACP methyl ester carboxylesterase|nr:alpha/beta fold hydrolase [Acidobacteriaceae bacterium]
MKLLVELSCRLYEKLISFHEDSLQYRYSEEMQLVFRESLTQASKYGFVAMARVWADVLADLITLLGPVYGAKIGILTASIACSSALILTAALGFCTIGPVTVVHGYSVTQVDTIPGRKDRLVTIPGDGKIFLSCWEPREIHGIYTVILATGRGIGDHTGWVPLQTEVSKFARVCSYDPLGAGKSDPKPAKTNPEEANIDVLVDEMHTLFKAADLPRPYILVGTSAGGVLARRYETRYPSEVGGFVFADSAHEEQEWRDAAIAPSFSPGWNDAKGLRDEGMMQPGEHLTWHDDVPMVVLERSERAPYEAFPNLTHTQVDGINDAWHSFQVDLSHRSKYAQLRIVQGAGHRMVMQKPEAVAEAVKEVADQMLER